MISLVSKCNQFYKIFNKQDLKNIRNLLSNDIVLENSKGLIIANGIDDFVSAWDKVMNLDRFDI